jgi:SAM-dependent methyltransferase
MKPFSQPPPPPDSNPKTYETVHKLLGLLKAGARILDAPCGSGRLTWVLLRGGYQVVPGDINVAKYKLAEPPITFVDLNGPIPFPDQHFDAAVFCEGPQVGAPGVIAGKCTVSVLIPSPQHHMSETIATPSGLMCPW